MQTLISDTANAGGPDAPKFAPNTTSAAIERLADRRAYINGPPHDVYAQLRVEAPVARRPPLRPGTGGFWALTRYADVTKSPTSRKSHCLQSFGDDLRRRDLI